MTFVAPASAIFAAAIAVPLLLLLYFLKLRRRYVRIPSTLLWRHSTEDLQVNVPFQRLRASLMLLLQLLVLAALLLALAQPRLAGVASSASRVVLLIDRSASMSARDPDGEGRSRLDRARETARDMIESYRRGGGTELMLVSFAASAEVVSGFASDAEALREAVDSIGPSAARADLADALRLADAFARQTDESETGTVDVVLISDGGVEQAGGSLGFALQAGEFRFVRVGPEPGEPVANLGIVSFSARRDFDDPGRVLLFARLLNAGPEAVDAVLMLRRDGEVAGLEQLRVPGVEDDRAGEASATFALELREGAVFHLAHNVDDELADDDEAWLVLPPPGRPRLVLVHGGERADPFLQDALGSIDPESLDVVDVAAFEALALRDVDGRALYDLVVFDRVAAPRLPGVPSITFGAVPAGVEVRADVPPGGRRLLTWERQHPLLRHVGLDDIVYSGFGGLKLPAGAAALALGPEGPVIAQLGSRGARHVVVGFELARSNWPVQVSFAVFLLNAIDYLTLAGAEQGAQVHAPGEPITVRARTDVDELRISGGDVGSGGPGPFTLPVERGGLRTLPPLERVGVYAIEGVLPPSDRIAVSMLDDGESDIRPRGSITVNARSVEAGSGADAAPRELWPWLVALAGVLLVLEWLTWCWRMSR